jgi:hypothetical protein
MEQDVRLARGEETGWSDFEGGRSRGSSGNGGGTSLEMDTLKIKDGCISRPMFDMMGWKFDSFVKVHNNRRQSKTHGDAAWAMYKTWALSQYGVVPERTIAPLFLT